MAAIRDFEDLEIWKNSRELANDIYKISKQREFRHDFALRDQIRRASISAMSNIAEGFERGGNRQLQRAQLPKSDRNCMWHWIRIT
ncbi:MAG TPA: four helix bundle protein [Acidobacteriota bacterium]|jgi:four helix bundle protein